MFYFYYIHQETLCLLEEYVGADYVVYQANIKKWMAQLFGLISFMGNKRQDLLLFQQLRKGM